MLPRFRKQGHLLIGQRKCGNWTDTRRLLEKLEGFLERMGKIERSLNGYPIWFNLFFLFYTYLQFVCHVFKCSLRFSFIEQVGGAFCPWNGTHDGFQCGCDSRLGQKKSTELRPCFVSIIQNHSYDGGSPILSTNLFHEGMNILGTPPGFWHWSWWHGIIALCAKA